MFVTDGDKRIATIDTLTVDNKVAVGTLVDVIRYQYDNHLGSASLELDENAATISYEEYHPFGTSSYRLSTNSTEVSRKRYRYVGKERDEETGLYYYGARYYAAWIGRFCSVDPRKEQRSWLNPYNYCQNNPINRTDPTGALDDEWDYNISTGKATKVGDKGGKETQHINIKDGDGNLLNTVTTPGSDFRIDQTSTSNEGETDVNLKIWGSNGADEAFHDISLSNHSETQVANDESLQSNNIEGQLPSIESQPEASIPVDDASQAITIAGIGSDIGQYSSRASRGLYKNSKGKVVKIESLKEAKGKVEYSKQGNVKKWNNSTRYSKHAKSAIKATKFFRALGNILGPISSALDWSNVIWGNGDWKKASVNTAFTVLAMTGGPIGAAVSALYFLGDILIPGGWSTPLKHMKNSIMQIHDLNSKDGVMMAPWLYGK